MQHKLWHNGHEVESTPLKKFFFKAGFFELLLYLCILVDTVATNCMLSLQFVLKLVVFYIISLHIYTLDEYYLLHQACIFNLEITGFNTITLTMFLALFSVEHKVKISSQMD